MRVILMFLAMIWSRFRSKKIKNEKYFIVGMITIVVSLGCSETGNDKKQDVKNQVLTQDSKCFCKW